MREEGTSRPQYRGDPLVLRCSGACAGADLIIQAGIATSFVLAANTLLRPIVNQINRLPLDVQSAEVTNTVYVVTSGAHHERGAWPFWKTCEELHYLHQSPGGLLLRKRG